MNIFNKLTELESKVNYNQKQAKKIVRMTYLLQNNIKLHHGPRGGLYYYTKKNKKKNKKKNTKKNKKKIYI
jgi:hypothetical protein